MKVFRWIIIILIIIFGSYYVGSKVFIEDYKTYRFESSIDEPVAKIFPQYNELQTYAKWQPYLAAKDIRKIYYSPYAGAGAQLEYAAADGSQSGLLTITRTVPAKSIRLELLENSQSQPIVVDIAFRAQGSGCKILYKVNRPPVNKITAFLQPKGSMKMLEDMRQETVALKNYLNKRSSRDAFLTNIRFDTIMLEKVPGVLLLGINTSSKNNPADFTEQLSRTHNKIFAFLTMDLGKEEDELGFPVLVSSDLRSKQKEKSFFYGVPVRAKMDISDNTITYLNIPASAAYSVYYQGDLNGIVAKVEELTNKIRKESKLPAPPQIYYLENPSQGSRWLVKIILPFS